MGREHGAWDELKRQRDEARAQIEKAREAVKLIDGADRDVINGRPVMDAAEEIEKALGLLRAALAEGESGS